MLEVCSIQRLCLHDGPGIRTTVFLRGCTLDCPWCCNPETKFTAPATYVDGTPVYHLMTRGQIFHKIRADKAYYVDDGGVTFSGGEPILQARELVDLFQMLKDEGISIYLETSLYVEYENLRLLDNLIDGYIVDLKIIDSPFFYCGERAWLSNFEYVWHKIKTLRMVLIGGVTDTEQNIDNLKELLVKYPIVDIEFLEYHSLGKVKANNLGRKQRVFKRSTEQRVNEILKKIAGAHYEKI